MLEACDLARMFEAALMKNLVNWFAEGIDGALVILVSAAFILLAWIYTEPESANAARR
jgi:hypothetical protein